MKIDGKQQNAVAGELGFDMHIKDDYGYRQGTCNLAQHMSVTEGQGI